MERIALFPGSFNPFTKGHEAIVRRALYIFDKVIIGIGINPRKSPENINEVLENIQYIYEEESRVSVQAYDTLTADFVAATGACCIIRGIRDKKDLEFESRLAEANYTLFNVDTVFLLSDPDLKEISSSMIRELQSFGKDVSEYLPEKHNIKINR